MQKEDRRKAALNALHDRAKPEWDYSLSRAIRWFYTVKALICLLLLRRVSPYEWQGAIIVAIWDYWEGGNFEGPDNGWKELVVGRGAFTDWYCDIIDNTSY
jgi:hypothetical protein